MLITVTQTKSGVAHFDIPSTGKGSRKKDLYSSFILAGYGVHGFVHGIDKTGSYSPVGLVRPRTSTGLRPPTITNILGFTGKSLR